MADSLFGGLEHMFLFSHMLGISGILTDLHICSKGLKAPTSGFIQKIWAFYRNAPNTILKGV